jgi:hypothetical protein
LRFDEFGLLEWGTATYRAALGDWYEDHDSPLDACLARRGEFRPLREEGGHLYPWLTSVEQGRGSVWWAVGGSFNGGSGTPFQVDWASRKYAFTFAQDCRYVDDRKRLPITYVQDRKQPPYECWGEELPDIEMYEAMYGGELKAAPVCKGQFAGFLLRLERSVQWLLVDPARSYAKPPERPPPPTVSAPLEVTNDDSDDADILRL